MQQDFYLVQHKSCKYKCWLNGSVCNLQQKWNHDYWCESKELDDWCSCNINYMWNPSVHDCECNWACKVVEYLDTKMVLIKLII